MNTGTCTLKQLSQSTGVMGNFVQARNGWKYLMLQEGRAKPLSCFVFCLFEPQRK